MSEGYEKLKARFQNGEIIILDGGIGSEMLRRGVTWEGHKVESEPAAIRAIHADYIRAGADVISTNTFQLARRSYMNHFADAEHMKRIGAADLSRRAPLLIGEGVKRVLEARDQVGRRDVLVAGAMTTLDWCFRPDVAPSLEEMHAEYRETVPQAREGLAGVEPDVLLFNCAPVPDITLALGELSRELRKRPGPRMGGYAHVGRFDPPDWMFTDEYPPAQYLSACREWVSLGAQVLGGCCGTTPMHIEALKKGLPRTLPV